MQQVNFYPRPPRGGRPLFQSVGDSFRQFLSTPSARRATLTPWAFRVDGRHFYPRPPRGGRRGVQIPSLAPK